MCRATLQRSLTFTTYPRVVHTVDMATCLARFLKKCNVNSPRALPLLRDSGFFDLHVVVRDELCLVSARPKSSLYSGTGTELQRAVLGESHGTVYNHTDFSCVCLPLGQARLYNRHSDKNLIKPDAVVSADCYPAEVEEVSLFWHNESWWTSTVDLLRRDHEHVLFYTAAKASGLDVHRLDRNCVYYFSLSSGDRGSEPRIVHLATRDTTTLMLKPVDIGVAKPERVHFAALAELLACAQKNSTAEYVVSIDGQRIRVGSQLYEEAQACRADAGRDRLLLAVHSWLALASPADTLPVPDIHAACADLICHAVITYRRFIKDNGPDCTSQQVTAVLGQNVLQRLIFAALRVGAPADSQSFAQLLRTTDRQGAYVYAQDLCSHLRESLTLPKTVSGAGDAQQRTWDEPRVYDCSHVEPLVAECFLAAGVLVVWKVGGEARCLLQKEARMGRKGERTLNLLGGKREAGETSMYTAAREFYEESGGTAVYGHDVTEDLVRAFSSQVDRRLVWVSSGRYALWVVPLPTPDTLQLLDLPHRFGQLDASDRPDIARTQSLHWETLESLQDPTNASLDRFAAPMFRSLAVADIISNMPG